MERTRGLPVWAAMTAGVLLAVVAASYWDMAGWAWAAALGLTAAAVISLIRYQIMPLIVATALSVGAGLAMTQSVPPWSIALCGLAALISGLAGRRMPRARPGLVVFAAGVAGAFALMAVDASGWINGLINLAITVVAPWLAGQYLRQQAELARAQALRARLQERARIAHDMHDSLGHELSLLALRAGALELDPTLQPRHRAAAKDLREGAAMATDRLAQIIGVIRAGDPAPLEPATGGISELVQQAAGAGMDATLTWAGPRELPSTVDRAAHRVVQEGLTNAAKHAPGAPVSVRVERGEATTTVTVTNGRAGSVPRNGSGARIGLIALRERVESAGGTLRTGPRDGGFELQASLPHGVAP